MSITLNEPIVITVSFNIEEQSFQFKGPKPFFVQGTHPTIQVPASDNPWPIQFKAENPPSSGVAWTFLAISFFRQALGDLPADSSWTTINPTLVQDSGSSGYEAFQNLEKASTPKAGENLYRLAVTNFPTDATEVTILDKNWNGGDEAFCIKCQLTISYPGPLPALFTSQDPQIQNEVDDGGTGNTTSETQDEN